MAGKYNIPIYGKIFVKLLSALFLAIFVYTFISGTFMIIEDRYEYSSNNQETMIRMCDYDYYEGDYGSLFMKLDFDHLYDEAYGQYWEAIGGYDTYLKYQAYNNIEGYEEKCDEYASKLQDIQANSKYPNNQRILEEFINEIQNK